MFFSLKPRVLDFTTAVRYEGVDMDSCFLSENPKPSIHLEDVEILSEMQVLPISQKPLTPITKVSSTNVAYTFSHLEPGGEVTTIQKVEEMNPQKQQQLNNPKPFQSSKCQSCLCGWRKKEIGAVKLGFKRPPPYFETGHGVHILLVVC